MHFMVYLRMSEGESMNPPSPEGMAEMGKLMMDAFESGMVVATGQLGANATHVSLRSGDVSITDGPFLEGKEFIPGFTIIDVPSREEAIQWATRLRQCMGDGSIHVSPLSATGPEDMQPS